MEEGEGETQVKGEVATEEDKSFRWPRTRAELLMQVARPGMTRHNAGEFKGQNAEGRGKKSLS